MRPLTCCEQAAVAGQVDQAGVEPVHPGFLSGGGVSLVVGLAAARLVDTQDGHRRRRLGEHRGSVRDERVVRDAPVHAELRGDSGHRPGVVADRFRRQPAGPSGDPRPRGDLIGQALGEHLPLARGYPAPPFPLTPQQDRSILAQAHVPRSGRHPRLGRTRPFTALRAPARELRVGRAMHDPPAGRVADDPVDDQPVDVQQQRTTLIHARGPSADCVENNQFRRPRALTSPDTPPQVGGPEPGQVRRTAIPWVAAHRTTGHVAGI